MIRVVISLLLLLPGLAFAQTREKPELKDFGSSLKKLKWDPEKNATAEINYGSSSEDDDVIKIETSLVVSELLVLDKQNRPVEGLKQSDFVITEEGTPQQVGHFLLGDNRSLPRSIVLIIDYSGSQFPYIKNSVAAASVLVDKLGPYDRMTIVTDDVEVLVGFTNDKRELKKKLNTLVEKSTKGND
ncbi:MAG TPA: VWA domain-containing protein, partial [Pyrinomonadaceae bacterium]|nr:VWA domain-containing protein [Pyrinomonadaceae bacterium]